MELCRADDRDPRRRGRRRARSRADRERRVFRALSDQAAAPAGARAGHRRRSGFAHRRTRPYRRSLRGVSPRSLERLSDHDSGNGTVKAEHPPIVIITSNRTREVHDALKRRCLYHWVGYPSAARELNIVRAKVPGIGKKLSEQVVAFVQALRKQELFK